MQGRFWLVARRRQRYIEAMEATHTPAQALDPELCRRARMARDPRFDGEFFLAVKTTGIYCRPICPARTPAEKNVSYFRLATQASAAGYRPCLRCRPELAPGASTWSTQDACGMLARQAAYSGAGTASAARRALASASSPSASTRPSASASR